MIDAPTNVQEVCDDIYHLHNSDARHFPLWEAIQILLGQCLFLTEQEIAYIYRHFGVDPPVEANWSKEGF